MISTGPTDGYREVDATRLSPDRDRVVFGTVLESVTVVPTTRAELRRVRDAARKTARWTPLPVARSSAPLRWRRRARRMMRTAVLRMLMKPMHYAKLRVA